MGTIKAVFSLRCFSAIFVGFLLSGYVLRPTPFWALVFYAGVLPWTAALAWRDRDRIPWHETGLWLGLAMILWFTLTVTWGVSQTPERVVSYIRAGVMNGVFLIAGMTFFAVAGARTQHWLVRGISLVAAANSAIAIGIHLMTAGTLSHRLAGWAETRHEILGAEVMIIGVVMTLRALATEPRRAWRTGFALALVLQAVFVVLTGSRGPLIGIAVAAGVYLAICRPPFATLAAGAASALAAMLLLTPPLSPLWEEMLTRDSYRLLIWDIALDRVAERPLLGHGVATVAIFGQEMFTFPHSLYISALFYGGTVGLVLLICMLGYAVLRAIQIAEREERAFLLALLTVPLVGGLTDIGQPIDSPSELWYILWLPVVATFGRTYSRRSFALRWRRGRKPELANG